MRVKGLRGWLEFGAIVIGTCALVGGFLFAMVNLF